MPDTATNSGVEKARSRIVWQERDAVVAAAGAENNASNAGDFFQGVQNVASIFLPADEAEVNTLRKRVNSLEVNSCLSRARFCSLPFLLSSPPPC